jgi:hypothetical protein
MKKTKRYEEGGDVDPLEAANQSDESQSIANEAKGEAMLKAMRDEAAKPKAKPMAKPAMPKAEYSNEGRSMPMPAPKNPNYSNEGRSMPAPAAKPITPSSKAKTAQAERDAEMAARRERTMGAIKGFGSFLSELPGKAMENYRSTRPGYKKQKEKEAAYTGNFSKGGSVSKASSRADGIAQRGKTRGKMC